MQYSHIVIIELIKSPWEIFAVGEEGVPSTSEVYHGVRSTNT